MKYVYVIDDKYGEKYRGLPGYKVINALKNGVVGWLLMEYGVDLMQHKAVIFDKDGIYIDDQ